MPGAPAIKNVKDGNWPKVKEIFYAALRRSPGDRSRFVIQACGTDKAVLAEVESLLASNASAESFMETPAMAGVADLIEKHTRTFEAGKCFGPYEILRQIGAGGMGEVYLANDTRLERKTAIKVLPGNVGKDEERMRRFVREAKSASGLNHPNIITIYEIGETDSTHFIATEYIEGDTLRERLSGPPIDLRSTLEIASQVASALEAAHRTGIVHRDIKPENVMVRPDGLVKLLDFGIAKLIEKPHDPSSEGTTAVKGQTTPGMVIGTARYMSPEQARGQAVDARSDLFSFGVMLYEMLAGKPPFQGDSALETIGLILHKEHVPLGRQASGVPAELERIINKALRKDREERYQTAKDLMIDLKGFSQDWEFQIKAKLIPEPQTEMLDRHATTSDVAPHTTSETKELVPRIKQYRRGFLAVVAVLLLAALGLGYWFYSSPPASTNYQEIKSVAVLPLENLSGDASQDYFADGMTEALIGNLSQIGSIKVISRTSVMRYKKSGKSIPEIAKELGVDGIIEGSVQRSGDRVRITTQLIHAASDSSVWTKNYERSVSDILKLQSEIAQAVASEIRIKLTPDEQRQFAKTRSMDPRATEAFLLGRHYFHTWTKESERQAVEQFQKAVNIEPEYADAWAGLADAWQVRGIVGDVGFGEAEKPARDAALKALELDPQNSAAHISMCFIYNNYDFDWARSESSCKRGIELDPNNAKGHFAYAYMLARVERWNEMAEQMETAMRLDPAEPWWPSVYGNMMIQARRFEDAEKYINRASEIDPNWGSNHSNLVDLYVETGKFDEALKLAEKRGFGPLSMAYIYARKGDRQRGLEFLRQAPDRDQFKLALVYTALDDFDKAFEALHESLDRRDGLNGYANYVVLDKLKSDPRWKDIARRMNLPQNPV